MTALVEIGEYWNGRQGFSAVWKHSTVEGALHNTDGVPSTMSTIEERLLNVAAEQLGVDREKMTLDATLETLGADSLDAVDLILMIENQFDVHIPDEESPKLDTARKMVAYIEAHAGRG